MSPEFPQYHYDACHLEAAQFHSSSGKTGRLDCSGGWHDAGDYGRYVVNSGITTGTLLLAYELNSEKLRRFDLQLPESGGALPDMLAEIRWNLDWMLKMQDADGGVWHKATTARFPGFVMPEKDREPTLIIGSGTAPFKTTQATADFAAVCAIAGRVYAPFDPAYAKKCTDAAERAWQWLLKTPDHPYIHNPEGIQTGGYGDKDARDERLWAAAELYRTTGDASAHRHFLEHYRDWQPALRADAPQGWANVENLAFYTYALCEREDVDAAARQSIITDAVAAADAIVDRVTDHGYRIAMLPKQYAWGSNSVVANYAMMLQLTNRLAPRQAYIDAAADAVHYLCGRNTFNTSFITHVGEKYAMRPHHRPSAADGVDEPWPGLLVGGPNVNQGRGELKDPTRPPARCWIDAAESYTMNENAINWNAAIVFVLADLMK
jgi:endoglucanase